MIRVVFAGPELDGFPQGREGGNCKLLIPEPGEARAGFQARLVDGPFPIKRTYTVRAYDAQAQALTIDFVAHGDEGPASRWAHHAQPGDFLGFAGPSQPKVMDFNADWYLLAADLSALPLAATVLEAMPRDAKGLAIFEVTEAGDRQTIDHPAGVEVRWLIHPTPHERSTAQEDIIRALDWPAGKVQLCIAGESGTIKPLRTLLLKERGLDARANYISGYWKIGLVEDEHQKLKRVEG